MMSLKTRAWVSSFDMKNKVAITERTATSKTLLSGCFDLSNCKTPRWNTDPETAADDLCIDNKIIKSMITTAATAEGVDLKAMNGRLLTATITRSTKKATTIAATAAPTKAFETADAIDDDCRYLTETFFKSSELTTTSEAGADDTGIERPWLTSILTPSSVDTEEEDDDDEDDEDDWAHEDEKEAGEEEGFDLEPVYHTFEDDDISALTEDEGFEFSEIFEDLSGVEVEDNLDGGSFVQYLSEGKIKFIDGFLTFTSESYDDKIIIDNCEYYDHDDSVVATVELPRLLGVFFYELMDADDY